jgi:hypothetical protein
VRVSGAGWWGAAEAGRESDREAGRQRGGMLLQQQTDSAGGRAEGGRGAIPCLMPEP